MSVRGIRGAITADSNEERPILDATLEVLQGIVADNGIDPEDICSVMITVTADLDAAFPAKAIREMDGWELVPLMCSVEVPVKGSLERCIRLMLMVNTDRTQREIRHVYMKGARALRPDLSGTSAP
ncbi:MULTISPECIES: chorismate mutase [Paenibacillus]|uniref:chorismate mutase n=1 Tax=Paenibacillus TaxID=44249 RepID=UPI00040AF90F|nr:MULTISPECIES: chorismate mutase [Paenibacillus]ASS65130.1 chorismate mutase [Paenibacillus sp. RUD330]KKC46266.1 chorismate mutase [Paenibacillus sp. D9]SIQ47177.1 chorismate mutase [Paenibacillus sp. RU4X]SIQ69055.1 chorismate mutase [Paenibacillus sp. RU4T]